MQFRQAASGRGNTFFNGSVMRRKPEPAPFHRDVVVSQPRLSLFRSADVFHFDSAETVAVEAELFCRPCRYVDDAPADIGSAIIDPHNDGSLIVEIGHAHITRERQ